MSDSREWQVTSVEPPSAFHKFTFTSADGEKVVILLRKRRLETWRHFWQRAYILVAEREEAFRQHKALS